MMPLFPLVSAGDPFGPLQAYYGEPLVPGVDDARLDLSLYLPTGYQLFDVKIRFLPEAPLSTDINVTSIGRMGEGTTAIATFYLDVNESSHAGVYQIPVKISYATMDGGMILSVERTIEVLVQEVADDPFGSLGVVTVPSSLVPGATGVQLWLSFAYSNGLVDRLYDVSISMGIRYPFSSANDTYYLGMMTSDSEGVAVFYIDVDDFTEAGEYDLPVLIRYRVDPDGPFRVSSKVAKLFVASEVADPFGSLGVVTVPSSLVPGATGVQLWLSFAYSNGLVDRLYDVSLSLDLGDPFSSVNDTYYLGMMTSDSEGVAVLYIDVADSAGEGVYQIPVTISYTASEGGPSLSVDRTIQIRMEEVVEAPDPFGSMIVSADPSPLVAGLRGVEVRLLLPYIGLPDRIYDVSVFLEVDYPFSSLNNSYYLGMMTVQSPIAEIPYGIFYLDVDKGATAGEYDLPVLIRYRVDPDGELRVSSKVAKLFVASEVADPFGSLGVTTSPSSLIPGMRGVEVRLSLPYLGGLVDRLYDVSLSLDIKLPFTSLNDSYYLGVVSPQSPIGPTPLAIFYLDVDDLAQAGEYDLPISIRYRLTREGEVMLTSKVAKLFVASEVADPFGSLGVTTSPSSLIPGMRGVEVRLSLPYLGGLVDRLYDVSLSLDLGDPFSSVNDTYYLGAVSPQSPIGPTPQAIFYLDVAESAETREHDVSVSIPYRLTQEGGFREAKKSIKLAVLDPDPVWVVKGLSDRLRPGSRETVSILLENKGGPSRSVTAQFIPEVPGIVKPEDGTQYVGDLGVNESRKLSYPVLVERGVAGNQLVTIRIEYSDGDARIQESHSITLRVGGLLGSSLILSNIVLEPEPEIGGEFEAVLKVENVGVEKAEVGSIDLDLAPLLSVVGSGSTIEIGEVPPGESKTVRVRIMVDPSASEGTLEAEYRLEWTNVEGEKFQREGSFGVPVTGSPRVVIQRIDIDPPKLESNTRGTFQVTVRNSGTQSVSDITIQLLGSPELFTETVLPIGSLLPKQSDSVIFGLFADPKLKQGIYAVTVSVSYLDPSGGVHEETTLIDLKLHKKFSIVSGLGLAIIVAIVAVAILVYIVFGDVLTGRNQQHTGGG